MTLGAIDFEGGVCNSSLDICASNGVARMGLTPAPSASRLKSRRFMTLPHSNAYMRFTFICIVKRNANILTGSHLRNDAWGVAATDNSGAAPRVWDGPEIRDFSELFQLLSIKILRTFGDKRGRPSKAASDVAQSAHLSSK